MKIPQKSQRKTFIEAHQSIKKVGVMVMLVFFTLFFVGFVSSAEWDNIKSYDTQTKTVTIINAFNLPLIGSDIATIKLNTPQNYLVGAGYQKVAEFEVNSYIDYTTAFKELELYDKRNNNRKFNRSYDYKYKTTEQVPIYETVCEETLSKNGTIQTSNCVQVDSGKTKIEVVWKDFNLYDFKKDDKLTIGIFTNVEINDSVEWIPNFFGIRINEWATWTQSLNVDISSYFKLDQTSGAVIDSVGNFNGTAVGGVARGGDGIINKSFNFEGVSDLVRVTTTTNDNTYTINFWIKSTNTALNKDFFDGNVEIATFNNGNLIFFVAEVREFGASSQLLDGNWNMMTAVANGTNLFLYINGDSVLNSTVTAINLDNDNTIGSNDAESDSFFNGSIDEFGIWNRSLTGTEVIQLWNNALGITWTDQFGPTVTLNSPIDTFNSTNQTIDFNGTVTTGDVLVNVSLIIDDLYNETNTTSVTGDFLFTKTLNEGEHNWTYEACDGISCINTTTRTFTINTTPVINVLSPTNNSLFSTPTVFFNASTSLPVDTWIVNYNGTNVTLPNINTSLEVEDGNNFNLSLYGRNSVTGVWGLNDTIVFSVDTTLPDINVTAPTGQINSHVIGETLDLNWSVEDTNLDSCWFNYNATNTTLTCGDNTTTFNTVLGKQNLTFYANDTVGNENSKLTSWTYAFLETGVNFNNNVTETSSQKFEINITTDITVASISSVLTYNGTNDTSTASCTGGDCIVSNTIDIPLVLSGETQTNDFSWTLTIFNGTSSSSITTSTRQQNVTKLHLELCDATYTIQSLNFTVYDEQTLTKFSNFTFDGTFDFWNGTGSIMRNNSISNKNKETALCLAPANETIELDATINYDEASGTVYTNRFYYFNKNTINNVSQDIFMYLLNSSFSTSFILKVQDDSLLPVKDAIIETHRFYPGTNEFRIVQIAKTDDNGKSIGFFQTETTDYKFIIKKNGVTLLETGVQKVVPETSPFTLTFNIGDPLGAPWSSQLPIGNLESNLTWDDTSDIVSYIYIDTSENHTLSRLLVMQESLVNSTANSIICNVTSALPSATLICSVGSADGFYVASSFITRDSTEQLDKQFSFRIETLSGVVGLYGLFLGWFLILIASFMFVFNEIAGIWVITSTVFFVNLIGLINFGGVFVTVIIAVAIILTWLMEK